MHKIRIGIDGNGFLWGGGIDFVLMLFEVLESTGMVQTYLILENNSLLGKMCVGLDIFFKMGFSFKCLSQTEKKNDTIIENFVESLKICSPNTKIISFKKTETKWISNREKNIKACLKKNKINILISFSDYKSQDFIIPRVGYIYDFQHKYLPNLFSKKECKRRDSLFQRQLINSKYVVVNAKQVKNDIEKFYPNNQCEIIVLPFKPFQKPECNNLVDLKKYHLPEKYFVICNQFWMHKSHITAFEALEEIYDKGIRDIHIVCTGLMDDDRNPKYIQGLMDSISAMQCRNNLHFLGYIPKEDQIQVMKNAIGLIQPTLFEGGPGGGAVYNALCLGLPCLVSDIPVNREIVGYDNVYFFEKQNPTELANLIIMHRNDKHIDEEILNKKIESNKKEYGEYLYLKLKQIQEDFYKNKI